MGEGEKMTAESTVRAVLWHHDSEALPGDAAIMIVEAYRDQETAALRADLAREIEAHAATKRELANAAYSEREACCAILGSREPNTKAERLIVEIDKAIVDDDYARVEALLSKWCLATADELSDLQLLIRARGQAPDAVIALQADLANANSEIVALREAVRLASDAIADLALLLGLNAPELAPQVKRLVDAVKLHAVVHGAEARAAHDAARDAANETPGPGNGGDDGGR